jgi:hypothetical protein
MLSRRDFSAATKPPPAALFLASRGALLFFHASYRSSRTGITPSFGFGGMEPPCILQVHIFICYHLSLRLQSKHL